MKFINVRELHMETARVLGVIMRGGRIIVTYRGRPCAAIIPLLEDDLESFVLDSYSARKKKKRVYGR
jgi:antitoxin (DNA-binding transcriptional repressor) of toxin-antitoxin stability system